MHLFSLFCPLFTSFSLFLPFFPSSPEFTKRFRGRQDLLEYAEQKGIPVTQTKDKPWSTDENLFHISYEAGMLEDPKATPLPDMYKLTADPETITIKGDRISIEFKNGVPIRVENMDDGTGA